MIKKTKKKNINFFLENKYFLRLNLFIYLLSVSLIVLIFLTTNLIFSTKYNIFITATSSLLIGIFLVYKRDLIVKKLSDKIHEKKRKKIKENNKSGLKTTLKKITPKRNIHLSIGKKSSFKEKFLSFKPKINKKNKNSDNYIEIK